MQSDTVNSDYKWKVTEEKKAVQRIVAAVDPLAVIVFGSRARGEQRIESDLDLAVILDVPEEKAHLTIPPNLFRGLMMSIDLLPDAKERFDRFRPWIGSVHQQIDTEGVKLYERGAESASAATLNRIC